MLKLEGIHHITAITGDAPRNVDFYARVLGMRLVKKTVNQDDPTVYHLFYGDEAGSPGYDLTFFEYPGAVAGRPGAGMVDRIAHRVASEDAIAFWADRLGGESVATRVEDGALVFADPEGLEHALVVAPVTDEALIAQAAGIADEHALRGFDHVRALTRDPEVSAAALQDTLGFTRDGDTFESRGEQRGGHVAYRRSDEPGRQGAGTVHHVAWSAACEDIAGWSERARAGGLRATDVIDRFYFRSVYFREPSGVLFEIATRGPGFTADEPAETLGEGLSLPPDYEQHRDRLAQVLTPLPDTRPWRRATATVAAGGDPGAQA